MTTPNKRLSSRTVVSGLIKQLKSGNVRLDATEKNPTEGLKVSAADAKRIIDAADSRAPTTPGLDVFKVMDSVVNFRADVEGELVLDKLQHTLHVSGELEDGLSLKGENAGSILVGGTIGGNFLIYGTCQSVTILESAEIGGGLTIDGDVGNTVSVEGSVKGNFDLNGLVRGDVRLSGSIGGWMSINRWAGTNPRRNSCVAGDIDIGGSVGKELTIKGLVAGDCRISGSVAEPIELVGKFESRVFVEPESSKGGLRVGSLAGARFGAAVSLGEGVCLGDTDFRRCSDLERIEFVGSGLFNRKGPAALLAQHDAGMREMAEIYRRIRRVLEQQRNRPGANAFYYGENLCRERAAWDEVRRETPAGSTRVTLRQRGQPAAELVVLTAYRWMSGYGLVAWRALAWFGIVAVLATLGFLAVGLQVPSTEVVEATIDGTPRLAQLTIPTDAGNADAARFSVQSMVSFLRPPEGEYLMPAWGAWIQILLRFLGPFLFAQVLLAWRARVAR